MARGLERCFGMRTAIATALVDNDVGLLLQDLLYQGGVDQSLVVWMPFDVGISDRANSAASKLKEGDFPWKRIFVEDGVRWFHCGGIFAALSPTTPEVVLESMAAARASGTVVSYDLNYRPSLWKVSGGKARAIEVNREIARVTREFPNLKAVATTLREVHSATVNDRGAVLWYDGEFYTATQRDGLEIMDRVGSGDSFASGLVYGFLSGKSPQACVEYGAAHGALAMTTPGDTSMASRKEVEKLAGGGGARVES